MFHPFKELIDGSVVAMDGKVGRLHNVLFNDLSWKISHISVLLRGWRGHRVVVIPVSTVLSVDWKKKVIRVSVTKKQVRTSPGVDSKKPVNRQQQIALRDYYGWRTEWANAGGEWDLPSVPVGREYPVRGNEDPHLRSAQHLVGYDVFGKYPIGRLESFIIDQDSWHIDYLDIKAGDWLHRRWLLIPTETVQSISWGKHRVTVKQAH